MNGSSSIRRCRIGQCLVLGIFMAIAAAFPGSVAGQVDMGVYNLTALGVTASDPTVTNVTLSAGRYRFTLVDPDTDPRATYYAWNPFGSGPNWCTAYTIGIAQTAGGPVTGAGGGQFTFSDTPADAWLATQSKTVELVVPFPQAIQLYVADSVYSDNSGGVSVLVQQVQQYVELQQVSDPVSIVNQTSYAPLDSTVSTITAPNPYQNYSFTYWTVGGVRMADPSGCATNPASFVLNGATQAVANYVLTTQDSAGDGIPDWWKLYYFGTLAAGAANLDPFSDGYTNALAYALGLNPNVANVFSQGGVSRRRGVRFNVAVGATNPNWDYGGVSRRRSATTTVILNAANYVMLNQVSTPPGIISQSSVVLKGSTVNLATPPDPYNGYRFTGWLLLTNQGYQRYDLPTQLQPIPITVTADTTVVARYINQSDQTVGGGLPDWQEWFYFNAVGYGPNDDPIGDGFTLAQDQTYGFSPVVTNSLEMGGVSRRRSMTTVVVNPAKYAMLNQVSTPAGIISQSAFVVKGSTVNLITPPDPSNGYRFTGWLVLTGQGYKRYDQPTWLQPIPITVNADTTVMARYISQSAQTAGGGLPDWQEWFYFNAVGYGPNDDPVGDGFTLAQDQTYGFSPVVTNSLGMGGVSRRRGVLTAVNAIFLPNPPAVGAGVTNNITPTGALLSAVVNPIGSPTTVYFQWGVTTSYGNATAPQSIGSGLGPISVVVNITGLAAGIQYHFRLVATNAQGTTQGSDFTIVTPPFTYATWAANSGLGGPLEDPQNAGLPNLVQFAFGMNPANPDRSLLPTPQNIGNNFVLNFNQPAGVSGVTYGAEYSTSLTPTNWQPITDTGSGTLHIFSVPVAGNPQFFLRLTVTEQ